MKVKDIPAPKTYLFSKDIYMSKIDVKPWISQMWTFQALEQGL